MAKIQIKSEKHTPFGGIFSGYGEIWLHIVFCNRLNPWSKVYNSLGHFNGYTFLNMQLRLKKNKHFEVSRWLLLKDFDLQSLFHRYVILLSNFFT